MTECVTRSTAADHGGTPVTPAKHSSDTAAVQGGTYRALAGFRFEIRRFFAFSRQAIEGAGLPPVQYQAMLAIKAHSGSEGMSVSQLADQLFIRVPTATELVSRLEAAGLIMRSRSEQDRRRVILKLTPRAEGVLLALAAMHLSQLKVQVPEFVAVLTSIAEGAL